MGGLPSAARLCLLPACHCTATRPSRPNRSTALPPPPPGFLRRLLGRAMLVSCEVAVEYYLALIHSPQVGGRYSVCVCVAVCACVDLAVGCGRRGGRRSIACGGAQLARCRLVGLHGRARGVHVPPLLTAACSQCPCTPWPPTYAPSPALPLPRLAATAKLQIQWMQQTEQAWPLQREVEAEVDAAYHFIIDRWVCMWMGQTLTAG